MDTVEPGRARILDAAIRLFAEQGVAATSVRAIAAEAQVSPGLVIHHFGSKDALRVACDRHVAAIVRRNKQAAVAQGPSMDPVAALRAASDGPPVLRYLARTLVDGSPHVAELVDELVDDAVGYITDGIASGMLRPSDDPRGRALVLTIWSLGSLVLHEHVARLAGVDLVGDPADLAGWAVPAAEVLDGVLADGMYEQIREAFITSESTRS